MEQHNAVVDTMVGGILHYLIGVGRLATDDDQIFPAGQLWQGLHGEHHILALLNGADVEDIVLGQRIAAPHCRPLVVAGSAPEVAAAILIDDINAVGRIIGIVEDVALGALADGDDAVGLAQRAIELAAIEHHVEPMIVFGMAQKDEIVDRHHGLYARTAHALGQFTGESVIQVDAVAPQIRHDTLAAPQVLSQSPVLARIGKAQPL